MTGKDFIPSIEQLETTNQAYTLKNYANNDVEFAESIGIAKVTMYTRLKLSNWTKSEIYFINHLHQKLNK